MTEGQDITFKAGEDLSSKQYYIVELTAENTVKAANATTDLPLGILQNDPASGGAAIVRISGRSKINVNEAITVGALVGPAADGQGAPYVAGTDTTKYAVGQCIKAADNAGEIGEVIVKPFARLQ